MPSSNMHRGLVRSQAMGSFSDATDRFRSYNRRTCSRFRALSRARLLSSLRVEAAS